MLVDEFLIFGYNFNISFHLLVQGIFLIKYKVSLTLECFQKLNINLYFCINF